MDATSIEWTEIVLRLGLAALLGGALGLEREYDGQDAGFRTHLLVVLGAALFALVSVGAFDAFVASQASTNVAVDVTRIAAYVAPGIGFIGGGAILKYGGHVTGITTAASLWSAAAVGVAAGLGFWLGAAVTTGIALIALEALRPVSDAASRIGRRRHAVLRLQLAADVDVATVIREVQGAVPGDIRQLRYGIGPEDDGEITVELWRPPSESTLATILSEIAAAPGVTNVSTTANL